MQCRELRSDGRSAVTKKMDRRVLAIVSGDLVAAEFQSHATDHTQDRIRLPAMLQTNKMRMNLTVRLF